jgi:putative hydrolase of the HAD superfamily
MIRFVYLDAAGTLLHPWPSVGALYTQACRPFGLQASAERAQEIFRSIWVRRIDAGDRGLVQAGTDEAAARSWWRGLVYEVLDGLEFAGDREQCFEACYAQFALPASWRVYEEVTEVVAGLRRLGLGVGVLSNWDTRLPALLEGLGLADLFDTVIVSALVGHAKPDPEIFGVAARQAHLEPHHLLHVGDHPRLDQDAARRAGYHALLVDRQQSAHGVDVIHDLRGIEPWLAARLHKPVGSSSPEGD